MKKFKKYDILEITWIDSHSGSGWHSPKEKENFIGDAKSNFTIKTLGYYFHEDKDFIRVAQGFDNQSISEGRNEDNLDSLMAVAKPCIRDIKVIRYAQKRI